jgi:hypothetical protein
MLLLPILRGTDLTCLTRQLAIESNILEVSLVPKGWYLNRFCIVFVSYHEKALSVGWEGCFGCFFLLERQRRLMKRPRTNRRTAAVS